MMQAMKQLPSASLPAHRPPPSARPSAAQAPAASAAQAPAASAALAPAAALANVSSPSVAAAEAAASAPAAAVDTRRTKAALDGRVKLLKRALNENIAILIKLFKRYDRNGNGSLDRQEFRDVVCSILKLPAADADTCSAVFDEVDFDKSGEISHYECLRFMLLGILRSSVGRIISLFKLWDYNCDGEIDREEFLHGFETMGCNVRVMREAIYRLFDELDEDGSGTLDYEELARTLKRPPNAGREEMAASGPRQEAREEAGPRQEPGRECEAAAHDAMAASSSPSFVVSRAVQKLRQQARRASQVQLAIAAPAALRASPPATPSRPPPVVNGAAGVVSALRTPPPRPPALARFVATSLEGDKLHPPPPQRPHSAPSTLPRGPTGRTPAHRTAPCRLPPRAVHLQTTSNWRAYPKWTTPTHCF